MRRSLSTSLKKGGSNCSLEAEAPQLADDFNSKVEKDRDEEAED